MTFRVSLTMGMHQPFRPLPVLIKAVMSSFCEKMIIKIMESVTQSNPSNAFIKFCSMNFSGWTYFCFLI